MEKLLTNIFLLFCIVFLIGTFRTYLRTGLKGELLRTTGILILLSSYFMSNFLGMIIGFIIFNIGWIMLVTVEHDKKREIFRQTKIIDRVIGNVPMMIDRKDFPRIYNKTLGVLTGVICLLISFLFIKRLDGFELERAVFIGILIFAGVFFVFFSLVKRK